MAQLDMSTYMAQVFWMLITIGVYYVIIEGEGGMKEKVSKMIKVRGKLGQMGNKEEETEVKERISMNIVRVVK